MQHKEKFVMGPEGPLVWILTALAGIAAAFVVALLEGLR